MSPVNPPTLEDSPGSPAKPQGPALETLTSAQIEQDCSDLVLEILSEAVMALKMGNTAPQGPRQAV